ncbi:uncharacterized protein ATC70_005130 [Mucor velutinosus]|uniref:BHLH domain-containing protein n=1 Tax=Mucor velutinosus TaxID=708070 RepID=A0AAN7HXI1_9FUNG|nr:hypothetical protein ATC70_005130 [Mucor velutinosus]
MNTPPTTAIHHTQSPPSEDMLRPGGLPPIQLPPPIVHFYIAPPPISPYQNWPLQSSTSTPPSPRTSSPSKTNIKENNRRLSHSAVEKRRREKMNDKIERLKTLIPSCKSQFPTTVQQPIHKLSVLQAAIDYIQELHDQLEANLPQDDPILKSLSVVTMKKNKSQ